MRHKDYSGLAFYGSGSDPGQLHTQKASKALLLNGSKKSLILYYTFKGSLFDKRVPLILIFKKTKLGYFC